MDSPQVSLPGTGEASRSDFLSLPLEVRYHTYAELLTCLNDTQHIVLSPDLVPVNVSEQVCKTLREEVIEWYSKLDLNLKFSHSDTFGAFRSQQTLFTLTIDEEKIDIDCSCSANNARCRNKTAL